MSDLHVTVGLVSGLWARMRSPLHLTPGLQSPGQLPPASPFACSLAGVGFRPKGRPLAKRLGWRARWYRISTVARLRVRPALLRLTLGGSLPRTLDFGGWVFTPLRYHAAFSSTGHDGSPDAHARRRSLPPARRIRRLGSGLEPRTGPA